MILITDQAHETNGLSETGQFFCLTSCANFLESCIPTFSCCWMFTQIFFAEASAQVLALLQPVSELPGTQVGL